MKRYLGFIGMLSLLISCQEDVKFNNPSFQGQKDNVFWRAIQPKALLGSNGSLVIEAYSRNEKVTLRTTSTTPQTYLLGTSTSKMATYVFSDHGDTITFSTGSNIGNGEIVITEFDAVNNTVSGTFKFNAENIGNNPLGGPVLNFQHGIFYKVPVSSVVP